MPAFVGKVVIYGVVTGIAAAIVSAPVVVYLFGGVTGSGSGFVVAFFLKTGQQLLNSALLAGLHHRADRQDLAGAARRPALPRDAAGLHRDAAADAATGFMSRDDSERSHRLRPCHHRGEPSSARDLPGLAAVLAVTLILALAGGRRALTALMWSAGIVLPLAAFMALVWVGIVGRAPAEIAAGVEGSRAAAAAHVALVCLRLFVIAFAIQATMLRFAGWTPLAFVRALTAPPTLKKLLVLTLSLIETTLHAVDRARAALIAAGIITRGHSWRNLRNGWVLVQTVWLTVITIAIGRMRDKWPIEGTLARLDGALAAPAAARFAVGRSRLDRARARGRVAALGLR